MVTIKLIALDIKDTSGKSKRKIAESTATPKRLRIKLADNYIA